MTEQPKQEFVWFGDTHTFTGEYTERLFPSSQRVALRNKKKYRLPIYRNARTGELVAASDMKIEVTE